VATVFGVYFAVYEQMRSSAYRVICLLIGSEMDKDLNEQQDACYIAIGKVGLAIN